MIKISLKEIEQQVQIVQNLPLLKDIQNLIQIYIEQSLTVYYKWATYFYNDTLVKLMKKNIKFYNTAIIIRQIVKIFIQNYGLDHLKLINDIQTLKDKRNLSTIHSLMIDDILSIFAFEGDKTRNCSATYYSDSILKNVHFNLNLLWKDYQSPIFKYFFEHKSMKAGYILSDLNLDLSNDNLLIKLKEAFTQQLDIFEIDVFVGLPLIILLLSTSLSNLNFVSTKHREDMEVTLMKMMNSSKIRICDRFVINTEKWNSWNHFLRLIVQNLNYGGNTALGWSPTFCFEILKKINLHNLNIKEKQYLKDLLSIHKFRSKEMYHQFHEYLQNFQIIGPLD